MGNISYFEGLIEEKLLNLHTAYIAKVISYNNGKANIQPLTMVKAYGQPAKKQPPLSGVPVIQSARYKLAAQTIMDVTNKEVTVLQPTSLSSGDIVFCVCADRDISETKNGNTATPQIGHHSMSDSVIVGVL